MSRCMLGRTNANRFFLVVETQKGPSMRYLDSTFGSLLKPIDRRWFAAVVDCYDGDAYDKCFKSWDHLVTLIFAQLGHVDSLRGVGNRLQRQRTSALPSGCGRDRSLDAVGCGRAAADTNIRRDLRDAF